MSEDILSQIDGALGDWAVSADAMRCAPDKPILIPYVVDRAVMVFTDEEEVRRECLIILQELGINMDSLRFEAWRRFLGLGE